jgi:hypothetical protein
MTPVPTKTTGPPKTKHQRFDLTGQKRKKPSSAPQRPAVASPLLLLVPQPSSVSIEPVKSLPLTIFDFNGSPKYYEFMSPFIDTSALHLICIHTADFHQATPDDIEEVFNSTFDPSTSSVITQLFKILQVLCEKVTKIHPVMIVPIGTCIDLYDKRPEQDK